MYYHITETTALSVRDRIVDFCKIHFQRKENWHLVFGVAERLYNYRAPIIGEFYEDGGEYPFSDVSEAGFLFVLKQMKKVGSLRFGWENTRWDRNGDEPGADKSHIPQADQSDHRN